MENSIKKGDIIELGQHRLVCGDATDNDLIKKLIGNDKIRLVLTDPPYGVGYVENKDWLTLRGVESKHFKNHKVMKNDELQTKENYTDFTSRWIEAIKPYLEIKNAFYIFNSDLMICALRQGMIKAKIYYSQLIIWLKNSIVLGRKDYNPQHELIAYGWYGSHKFERAKARSVIAFPKPHRSTLHPTMKPIGLLRKLILNSSKTNDIVYDPFGGSGSTLIACEQLKRKCLMIELDPDYCKIIIDRYNKLWAEKQKE